MKAFALLFLFIGYLLAWEPLPKFDNKNIDGLNHLNNYAKKLHYSDKLLYFLDSSSFEISGKLYILNNKQTDNEERFVYQSLSSGNYYISKGSPITEENPFGWKKTDNLSGLSFLGYMLFIDFPKDPKAYRAYSWVLVNPELKSFKKLIGADPKGGFRWYVDEGWKKRVFIEKEDNTITFKTRGIGVPLLKEQEDYYFGYQTFSGEWSNADSTTYNKPTSQTYSYNGKTHTIFCSQLLSDDDLSGNPAPVYFVIIEGKSYLFDSYNQKVYFNIYLEPVGYKNGCVIYKTVENNKTTKIDYLCKTDNAIGESAIQKNPYRGEITTDTSKLPKPTSDYDSCWE